MKGKWKTSLGLSLGLLVSGTQAAELPGRAAAPRPATGVQTTENVSVWQPAARLQRPVAKPAATQTPSTPAATLDRPVPRGAAIPGQDRSAVVDPQVRPVLFQGSAGALERLATRNLTAETPRPLPVGPPLTGQSDGSEQNDKDPPNRLVPAPAPEVIPTRPTPAEGVPGVIISDCCPDGELFDCCTTVCGPGHRFYASAEYLLWWLRDSHTPALVTGGSAGAAFPGALGQPGTTVLFGNSIDNEERSGGRFTLGYWFNPEHTLGIEGTFFFLGQRTINSIAASGGSPVLARPFLDAQTGREDAQLVAFPNVLAGSAAVSLSSRLWGAEINLRKNLCCGCWYNVDGLLGFRYLDLEETLRVTEQLTALRDPGGSFVVIDRFRTENRFYGEQVGTVIELRKNRCFLELKPKVALGLTRQTADITGSTAITSPGDGTVVLPGGLLAQQTNSGRFSRDIFTVVPEVGVNVGYQINDHWRAFVGYNFLYWSSVLRPGDQIDRTVNVSQLPPGALVGPARPAFAFKGTDFWVHGVNFGLELRY